MVNETSVFEPLKFYCTNSLKLYGTLSREATLPFSVLSPFFCWGQFLKVRICFVRGKCFAFKYRSVGRLSPGKQTGPEVIKLFFMLNSIEHEILNAHKYKSIKKFGCF